MAAAADLRSLEDSCPWLAEDFQAELELLAGGTAAACRMYAAACGGDRVSRRTAWRIADEQGWDTLRDAEHLAVVRLQADALVTVDPDLAARAAGIVPIAPLEALFTDGS